MELTLKMLTIRQIVKTGSLTEHALRFMVKLGRFPALYIGKKVLINYERLCEHLDTIGAEKAK